MRYIALLLVSIGCTLVASVSSTYAATPPDSCFAFDSGTGTITDYYNNEANNSANPACTRDVDIPSTIGGTSVTSIGALAFYNNQLTSVTIPASVTSIGTQSFGYNQLTSVTIPPSIVTITSSAFTNNELTSIVIPVSVTTIESYAFHNNQLTALTIPSNVTSVGASAFQSNELATVTVENAAATLQHSSFVGNPVASMTIGATSYSEQVPTTEPACFAVSGSTITDYYQASPIVARDDGVLCGRDVIVSPGTTTIADDAFVGNRLLSVDFPSTVTSIGFNSFAANDLSSIVIPDSVTFIDQYAFFLNQLTSVQLSQNITDLPWGIFESNELTTIDLPESITTINEYAFANNQLQAIELPSGLTTLGDGAFAFNQLSDIAIPDGVTVIGYEAFNCNNLVSVTLPANLTTIDSYAFWNNSLESVQIPTSLATIGTAAFARQSPFGCGLWDELSATQERMTAAYESIFLTKFYTENQANPQNLQDTLYFMSETSTRDYNGNGVFSEKLLAGGYLINPASAVLSYTDEKDETLHQAQTFSGTLDDNYLNDYRAVSIETSIIKPTGFNPTPEEAAAYRDVLSGAYYRIGDSVTIDPPAIDGYITPEPQTFVLGAADNTFSYVYATADTPGAGNPTSLTPSPSANDDELADTGLSTYATYFVAISAMLVGTLFWKLNRRLGYYRR